MANSVQENDFFFRIKLCNFEMFLKTLKVAIFVCKKIQSRIIYLCNFLYFLVAKMNSYS